MSDPIVKGVKRSPARPASRRSASTSSKRTVAAKSANPKPISKREPRAKAPAKKAAKSLGSKSSVPIKGKPLKKVAKPTSAPKRAAAKTPSKAVKKQTAAQKAPAKREKAVAAKKTHTSATAAKSTKSTSSAKPAPPVRPVHKAIPPAKTVSPTPRVPQKQHFIDEAAALQVFQRAYGEFSKGHFSDARKLFKALIERYSGGSDVVARGRTYLAIAESRLRTDASLPRDADSLYDRGVIELNRGEFVAAQEMFERALKQEPEGAHIHYGLAASRARLGSLEAAMDSLKRALNLQPNLRVRAQHDADLMALRNDPEFDRLLSQRT